MSAAPSRRFCSLIEDGARSLRGRVAVEAGVDQPPFPVELLDGGEDVTRG